MTFNPNKYSSIQTLAIALTAAICVTALSLMTASHWLLPVAAWIGFASYSNVYTGSMKDSLYWTAAVLTMLSVMLISGAGAFSTVLILIGGGIASAIAGAAFALGHKTGSDLAFTS